MPVDGFFTGVLLVIVPRARQPSRNGRNYSILADSKTLIRTKPEEFIADNRAACAYAKLILMVGGIDGEKKLRALREVLRKNSNAWP